MLAEDQQEQSAPSPLLPAPKRNAGSATTAGSSMRRELTMQHLRESYARRLSQEKAAVRLAHSVLIPSLLLIS